MTRRFLSDVATALQAECGAVFLIKNSTRSLTCAQGPWSEGSGEQIPLEVNGQRIGELWLVPKRGAKEFTTREMAALRRCAATTSYALMLADRQQFLASLMP